MADANEKQMRYRRMILNLSNMIRPEEVQSMKFLCKDFIKAGQRDKIKDFLELITILEERKEISSEKIEFLNYLLENATKGRRDVFDAVHEYQPRDETVDAIPEYPAQRDYTNPELRQPIELLKRKLGRDWRFFVRNLGVDDFDIDNLADAYPRDVKEQIHRAIKIYLNEKRERSSKQDLIDACKKVKRMDLARKLEADDYN
ncbi:FAS-associated death domain protein-like [Haliotis rubra]|uniref:FAS-associated death domain protein-like n=1 Tax=Haliotis rubra TaxID=36100 RepID=UPI001EE5F573|nr:FAS-associated death domain protein-like [Haliotis rubra]XP_046584739.1 FAS-associated death domain protein-like [Haliotis rubra]XP_046584740.1 FAS-associated death domain protein-like [Haliotis rubra]XP_046584741.1 FAS-associated death domain protein-like [Haliotis rubra]